MRSLSLPLALAAILLPAAALAQPIPDAGQVSRELQRPLTPPPAAPPRTATEAEAPRASVDGPRVQVQAFRIVGNTAAPTADLEALVTDQRGRSLTVSELNVLAGRITAYYRARGFSVARAYVPAQEIAGGVVTINVLEGRIDARRLTNGSRLSDRRVDAYLDDVRKGEVIRSAQIDRGLLLLNDTPGVAGARAALQPGASVGAADLIVEVSPGALVTGGLSADNYGNRYTGRTRLGGGLAVNSPLGIGDQLALDAVSSGEGLTYGRIAYQAPIGENGLRVGAAYFDTRYELGQDFKALDAHGKASSASLFAVYPFIRSQQANLNGTVSIEEKRLTDMVGATGTTTSKRTRLAAFGLLGSRQDRWLGGGVTSASLSVTTGELDIRSPAARAIDAASARSAGRYTRATLDASRFQQVTAVDYLLVAVSGQWAGKNLDSSEKFTLSGIRGVRAYPQGQGVGDEGALVSVEWRRDILPRLQAAVFYDAGTVRLNHDPFTAGSPNRRDLSGAGLGLYATVSRIQLKAAAAWRTGGGPPTSIPAGAGDQPTFWLQANASF